MSGKQTDEAREGLARTETGDAGGEAVLEQARRRNRPAADAAEQEASEAPEGRGLSR